MNRVLIITAKILNVIKTNNNNSCNRISNNGSFASFNSCQINLTRLKKKQKSKLQQFLHANFNQHFKCLRYHYTPVEHHHAIRLDWCKKLMCTTGNRNLVSVWIKEPENNCLSSHDFGQFWGILISKLHFNTGLLKVQSITHLENYWYLMV